MEKEVKQIVISKKLCNEAIKASQKLEEEKISFSKIVRDALRLYINSANKCN